MGDDKALSYQLERMVSKLWASAMHKTRRLLGGTVRFKVIWERDDQRHEWSENWEEGRE